MVRPKAMDGLSLDIATSCMYSSAVLSGIGSPVTVSIRMSSTQSGTANFYSREVLERLCICDLDSTQKCGHQSAFRWLDRYLFDSNNF